MNPKIKKIAFIVGLILVAILSVPLGKFLIEKVRAFPNSILSFSPASKIVGANQAFTLDAMIDPRTNQITAIEVHVTFDSAKFRLDGISTAGSPLSAILQAPAIDNASGTASFVVGVPAASPVVPVTSVSKVATFSFFSLAAASSSSIAFTNTSQAAALNELVDVLTDRNPSQVTVDAAPPAGGSVGYTNGYFKITSVAIAVSDGTDAVAGINTSSRIVQRKEAALSGTACGAYGSWATITPTGTYPNFTDTAAANGKCYQYQYLVSDNVGNQAAYASVNVAKVDTVAPAVAQVAAVSSPTKDSTPDYTFSSTEAGAITYSGDCSSTTTAAVTGNNTITFNSLSSATHSNCAVRVTDAAGNQSGALSVSSFVIDTAAPTIADITSAKANGTYSTGTAIDIIVTFSETVSSAGNVTVALDTGKSCSFAVNNSTTGSCNYTVQSGDNSADLTTTSISGTIADRAGNALTNFIPAINLGVNKNLVINASLPILSQVTAVSAITGDATPSYTFSSSKAGTISYGGDCRSATTSAVAGNNAIIFNALAIGAHSNCTITVADSSNNISIPLSLTSFVITYPGDIAGSNRKVDIFDYSLLVTNFGNTTCNNTANIAGNTTGTCAVDIFDYNALLQDFGKSF
ncbi:MAG: hypothetical protein WC608_00585 [Parcubacteria group bacterium]